MNPPPEEHFRTPAILQALAWFSLVFSLLMSIGSGFLFWQGEQAFASFSAAIWLSNLLAWVYLAPRWARSVFLEKALFSIRGPGYAREFNYAEIRQARQRGGRLVITLALEKITLHFAFPNQAALLLTALERRAPHLRPHSPPALFPLHLVPRRAAPLSSLGVGVGFILFGAGALDYAWQIFNHGALASDWATPILLGAVGLLFGMLLIAIPLFSFVWRYEFTPTAIILHFAFRRRVYDPARLASIDLDRYTTLIRGMPWVVYSLKLTFLDGTHTSIAPNSQFIPIDYLPESERRLLQTLLEQLTTLYPRPLPDQKPE